MAIYAIGDVQGCFDEFCNLLQKIAFDSSKDTLWLAGDIVSRGPKSLDMLRYAFANQAHCKLVLGNHDLHLLASYFTGSKPKVSDNLCSILAADDAEQLLSWLKTQPLALYQPELDVLLTHAGVPSCWDLAQTLACAKELELCLQTPQSAQSYFEQMYGNQPAQWQPDLTGQDRLRYITNALTRMRYCYPDGRLDFADKSAPSNLLKRSDNLLEPWYLRKPSINSNMRVLFGHWASLEGYLYGACEETRKRIIPLDTGCIWGGSLSAYRLEDGAIFSVQAKAVSGS